MQELILLTVSTGGSDCSTSDSRKRALRSSSSQRPSPGSQLNNPCGRHLPFLLHLSSTLLHTLTGLLRVEALAHWQDDHLGAGYFNLPFRVRLLSSFPNLDGHQDERHQGTGRDGTAGSSHRKGSRVGFVLHHTPYSITQI